MESARATDELQVSEDGLRAQAGWCESLAGRLAGNSAPSGAGASPLASSGAVNAAHAQIAAAGVRCSFRMQATATKLAEISFGSDLVGSGLDFGPAAGEYWFEILRSLRRKVSTYPRFLLLLENAGYPSAE